MIRFFLVGFFLLLPGASLGDGLLTDLEKTVNQRENLRPGLEQYSARLISDQISEVFATIAKTSSNQTPPAPTPELIRYWKQQKPALVVVRDASINGIARKTAGYFADQLAGGMGSTLIPASKAAQRRQIAGQGMVKTSETRLGQTLLKRIELTFEKPVSLQEAFFTRSFPLPQEGIVTLYFDLDAGTNTIQEFGLLTAEGLKLTAEMRYAEVSGGYLPERIKITSLDGSIDDNLEITYEKIEGFDLPVKFSRSVRRPGEEGELLVTFADFKINQPFPQEIRERFEQQQ